MNRPFFIKALCVIVIAFASCKDKPKSVSADIRKTSVTINGKRDSVINNPKANYGNSTIAEPCVRCMIKAVQAEDHFKKSISGIPGKDILYVVNWVKTGQLSHSVGSKNATNGLRLDVNEKGSVNRKLSSFVYDNSTAKLYFITNDPNHNKTEVQANVNDLKRIRNGCYWGVASGK